MLPNTLTASVERILSNRHSGTWLVLWAVMLLLGVFPYFRDADPDLFARFAAGEIVATTGKVAQQDPFAFTPKKEVWHDHEWLISVPFYALNQIGGDRALLLLKIGLFALTIVCILGTQRLVGVTKGAGLAWFSLFIPFVLNAFIPNVRCQMMTFLGSVFWTWAFAYARSGRGWILWSLPPAMVLWANSHGGFIVGLGFSAIFAAVVLWERSLLRVAALGSFLGCLGAVLVNPYGLSYVQFVLEATLHLRPLIPEWAPLPIFSLRWILLGGATCIVALGSWRGPRKISYENYAFLVLSVWQGFRSDRLSPLAIMVIAGAGAPLALNFFELIRTRPTWGVFRNAFAAVWVLFGLGALGLIGNELIELKSKAFTFSHEKYPVSAVKWLGDNRAGGNILVHFNESSYVLWTLRGRFKVAIDGRYEEVYPEETFIASIRALDPSDPLHLAALEGISPDFVIRRSSNGSIEDAFPGFESQFDDGQWQVLEKGGSEGVLSPVLSGFSGPKY